MRSRTLLFVALVAALAAPPARAAAPRDTATVILEPLRIVTDWLGDATYGVNAKLAVVPRDAGDPLPPSVQLIADETRSGPVARDRIPTPPAPGPVLTIACLDESNWNTELEDKHWDCEIFPIEIRYADLDKVISQDGTRNAFYTLRAVRLSLKDLMLDPGVAARKRNGVELVNTTDLMRFRPAMKVLEDKVVVAGMSVGFGVRVDV